MRVRALWHPSPGSNRSIHQTGLTLMKMAYWMRIGTGAFLGIAAVVGLWLAVGIVWLTALVAVLVAIVGFLGSFFVVSADRPEEGYEQVLFDRSNMIVTVLFLVLFAGAGIGTGFLGADAAPPDPADPVYALRADYLRTADAWSEGADADPDVTLAEVSGLRTESDRVAMELEALADDDARTHLAAANDALAFALDALKDCAEQGEHRCLDARLNAADAESALQRYAGLASGSAEPDE